jgi:hypothetical protein
VSEASVAQQYAFHPSIGVCDARLATLPGNDALRHFDPREPFVKGLVGSGFANEHGL